eukprot:1154090-Pelagomonas_calceolata.AAC.10
MNFDVEPTLNLRRCLFLVAHNYRKDAFLYLIGLQQQCSPRTDLRCIPLEPYNHALDPFEDDLDANVDEGEDGLDEEQDHERSAHILVPRGREGSTRAEGQQLQESLREPHRMMDLQGDVQDDVSAGVRFTETHLQEHIPCDPLTHSYVQLLPS